MLTDFEKDVIISRFEGWELVELLNIPISEVLGIALDYDWINSENVADLKEAVGLSNDEDEDYE